MNLLLLPAGVVDDETGLVEVTGRQAKHLIEVLHVTSESVIKCGIENTWIGKGRVVRIDSPIAAEVSVSTAVKRPRVDSEKSYRVLLKLIHTGEMKSSNDFTAPDVTGDSSSPADRTSLALPLESSEGVTRKTQKPLCSAPPLNPLISRPKVDLLVALPRPKTFDKLLQYSGAMGVGRLIFVCTTRTDLAYFSSTKLRNETVSDLLKLGVEQSACDPFIPEIVVYASWARCLREIPEKYIIKADDAQKRLPHKLIVLDPSDSTPGLSCPSLNLAEHAGPIMLAIGPEGGYVDGEVESLQAIGFESFNLGPRILKVETAMVAAMAQVDLLRRSKGTHVGGPSPPRCDTNEGSRQHINRSDFDVRDLVGCWCHGTGGLSRRPVVRLPIRGPDLRPS